MKVPLRILVTGANGYVGSRLLERLAAAGHEVTAAVRRPFEGLDSVRYAVIVEGSSYVPVLEGIDAVVHTAGVAHRSDATTEDYLLGNRDLTRRLAKEVAASGVKVLIHLSSIAAREAAHAGGGRAVGYGLSKLAAEPAVEALEASGKLGVNLRPPLIYGAGAPGNWGRLVRIAQLSLPLPFAAVQNRRSYLGLDHLIDAILLILARDAQPELSGTYEIADRDTFALPEVIAAVRRGFSRRPGLVPFPLSWMNGALQIAGKEAMAEGLFGNLLLDASSFETAFKWRPARATLEAMERSVI